MLNLYCIILFIESNRIKIVSNCLKGVLLTGETML